MAKTYGVSKKQEKKVAVLLKTQRTRNKMHTTAFSVNFIYSPGKIDIILVSTVRTYYIYTAHSGMLLCQG